MRGAVGETVGSGGEVMVNFNVGGVVKFDHPLRVGPSVVKWSKAQCETTRLLKILDVLPGRD